MIQALKTFGSDVGIAWSGAEDVALVEYAHLTGRPYRVFRREERVARHAILYTQCKPAWRHLHPMPTPSFCSTGVLGFIGRPCPCQTGFACLTWMRHLVDTQTCTCSLDTGRLNAETYRVFDAVEKHYGIKIEYTFPDAQETMDLVREKGMFSFYEDGHQECCRVRKVSTTTSAGQQAHHLPAGSRLIDT